MMDSSQEGLGPPQDTLGSSVWIQGPCALLWALCILHRGVGETQELGCTGHDDLLPSTGKLSCRRRRAGSLLGETTQKQDNGKALWESAEKQVLCGVSSSHRTYGEYIPAPPVGPGTVSSPDPCVYCVFSYPHIAKVELNSKTRPSHSYSEEFLPYTGGLQGVYGNVCML